MRHSPFSRLTLPATSLALLFALCAPVSAQTVRPSAATSRGGGTATGGGAAARRTTTSTTSSYSGGARQYRSNTMLGDAMIQIDPESRSLVVITDDETHQQIEKIITDLDQPKPQVLIKVLFLEVTYNKASDIGIEGSYTFHTGNPLLTNTSGAIGSNVVTQTLNALTGSGSTTSVTSTTTPVFPNNNGNLGVQSLFGLANTASSIAPVGATGNLVSLVTSDYQATLRLLATKGRLNVLSRPSILARNNQEAVIIVGQEVPFVTNSQITNTGQTINTIQYEDIGIILRVTPFITSRNNIEMIVAPEISQLSAQTVPISNGVNAPIIDKRSAETVVVTPHASTVVIGGLMETQRTQAIQKVPILGDIPILGFPFRRTVNADVKRELLIFLTPYIVNNADSLRDLTIDELNRTELTPKAFTPEEIAKHMDTLRLEDVPVEGQQTTTTTETEQRYEIRRAVPVQPLDTSK